MDSIDKLNALLNRALRAVNAVAICASASGLATQKQAIAELVRALESLTNVKIMIENAVPELVYHFDPGRPPTPFMRSISELVVTAEAARNAGDILRASEFLREALALEPPPLVFEEIEKRLKSLS